MHRVGVLLSAVLSCGTLFPGVTFADFVERELGLTRDEIADIQSNLMDRDAGTGDFIYNTDGCDVLYWPDGLAETPENFGNRRLKHALGTHVRTVSYCPISAGFGRFTCRFAGEPATNLEEGDALDLWVNGKTIKSVSFDCGLFTYALATDLLRRGRNDFTVTFPTRIGKHRLLDFAVEIDQPDPTATGDTRSCGKGR